MRPQARRARTTPSVTSLSIVVCTKNRPKQLATCLESVETQTTLPVEVVIVDAGQQSSEDIVHTFSSRMRGTCRVKLLPSVPGLPLQRNIGADATTGDIVLFLDDDVVLQPDYIEHLVDVYVQDDEKRIGGVGGALVCDPAPEDSLVRRVLSRVFLLSTLKDGSLKRSGRPRHLFIPREYTDVEFLSGCNMSFRREVLKVFRFDERLHGYALGEDLDFSYRVSRSWRLVMTPVARLDHRHAGGERPNASALHEMGVRNRFLFVRDRFARSYLDWLAYGWSEIGALILTLRYPGSGAFTGTVKGFIRIWREQMRQGAREVESTRPSRA